MFSSPPRPERAVPPQVPRSTRAERLPVTTSPVVAAAVRTGRGLAAALRRLGTPLVDDLGDGTCAVTFAGTAAAERVVVLPNKIADPADPDANVAEPVPGGWAWTIRMPRDWRASYAVAPLPSTRRDAVVEQRRARALATTDPARHAHLHRYFDVLSAAAPDPLARERLPDGTSVVSLPGAPPVDRPTGGPPGRLRHGEVGGRTVWAHETAGDPQALLVLLDGETHLDLPPVLDALVAAGRLRPLRAVGVGSGDLAARTRELGCDPAFVAHLCEDVLPWAGPEVAPDRTVVAGQSMGGLTALYATQAAPERFGRALVQSGSFWWADEWLTGALADGPRTRGVHLEVGSEEWVLRAPTARLAEVLHRRGDPLTLQTFRGGHDRACWRAGFVPALEGLLG